MISYFKEESAILTYMDLLDEVAKVAGPILGKGWRYRNNILSIYDKKFFKYSDRTTLDVLSDLTSDPKLIGVLTGQWGDYGLPPGREVLAARICCTSLS